MPDKASAARTMRIDISPEHREASGPETPERPEVHDSTTSFVSARRVVAARSSDYQQLLESIYDAVAVTDARGRIVDVNSRALDFFRFAKHEMVGSSVIDLISGADDALLGAIKKNLEAHRFTLIEAQCLRRDGSTFPAEIAVNQVSFGEPPQLCFFVRNITVRKKAQEGLEAAVRRLQEHDKARSDFVSNVSHELRTPLTSMIYAVTNMLRGVVGGLSPSVRRYLDMLQGDCRRLLATVDDILDLRKIESHDLMLAKVKFPLAGLVRRSVESLRVQAEQKALSMTLDGGDDVRFVECDPQKMERVILNVVGNAIKFTPKGGEIHVVIDEDPEQEGNVRVSIRDSGVGIPAEELEKVTLRYYTVGEQPTGSGLGLAMAQEIVEMHGGGLRLESPPQGMRTGTRVTLSLPVAEAPTVLCVDDDENVLNLLKAQIGPHGYKVALAGNADEAMAALRTVEPQVVVLDIALPGMSGTEMILKMKSDKEIAAVPVVVLTGAPLADAQKQVLKTFSIPVLIKPWNETELLDHVAGAFFGDLGQRKHPILKIDEPACAEGRA